MHGTDAIRASCASSADTSVMNSAGWAVSNHDAMTATACVMLFQPSGAQWRFAGVGAFARPAGSSPTASNSDGIVRTVTFAASGGKMSARAEKSTTGRSAGKALTIAAARSAWPRP